MDVVDKQKFIFNRLFLLSNKLQVLGDHVLTGEMTIRQWLLTVAISQYGAASPSLGEVALAMDSSHQNVKQLAAKLCDKGFITLERDETDKRATRLKLTEKSCTFWDRQQGEIRRFLTEVFNDLSSSEIDCLYSCLNKLYISILKKMKEA